MTDDRWQLTFELFHRALEAEPAERAALLADACGDDDELRQDQRYLMARDDRHQRALHGWGVVSGLDLGFASQASFTRFFTSNVGIPPTDYRRVAHFV